MSNSAAMVTIRCPDHHRRLTNGLWNLYQTKDGRDSELTCGGQSIKAHGMVMQLFLSTSNFAQVKKDSAVAERLQQSSERMLATLSGEIVKKNILLMQRVDERSEPVTKKKRLFVSDQTSTDADGSEKPCTTVNEFSQPGPLFEDGSTHEAVNSDSSALTYRCSKCRAVFSSEAGMLAHVKKFRSTKKCDNLLELVLEFLYKGAVTLSPERLDDLQATARQLDFQLLADAVEETKRCKPLNVVIPRVEHMLDTSSDGFLSAKYKLRTNSTLGNVRQLRKLPTEKPNSSQPDVCEDNENGDYQSCSPDFFVCEPDVPGSESDHSQSWGSPGKLQKLNVAVQQKQPPDIGSINKLINQQQDTGITRKTLSRRFHRHNKFANVSETFICPHCDFKTGVKYLYQKHLATHNLDELILFNCPKCDYKSPFYSNTVRHCGSAHSIDMEGNPLPVLKCAFCEYKTVARYCFLYHMRKHHPLERNANNNSVSQNCSLCQFTTPHINSLINHCASVHSVDLDGNSLPNLKCCKCEYVTVVHSNLIQHIRSFHPDANEDRTKKVQEKCTLCDYQTSFRSTMRAHRARVHSVDDKGNPVPVMSCTKCDYSTTVSSYLRRHLESSHRVRGASQGKIVSYQCTLCEYKTHIRSNISAHKIKVHPIDYKELPVKVMECTKCEYSTSIRHDLEGHIRSNHPELIANKDMPEGGFAHKCTLCDFKTQYATRLKMHEELSHSLDDKGNPLPVFECSMCQYSTTKRHFLFRHNRRSHSKFRNKMKDVTDLDTDEPKSIKCKICHQVLESEESREEHMTEHPMLRCAACTYESRSPQNLLLHRRRTHLSAGDKLTSALSCPHCDYLNKCTISMARHLVNIHADKMSEEYLSTHQICPLCQRLFTSVNDLEKHTANHEIYKCNLCDYETKRKRQLPHHRKNVHSVYASGKPMIVHKCSECNFSTNGAAVLKRHKLALHSGLKPYKCPYCDYATAWGNQVNRHIKVVHLDMKNHACNICDFRGVCQAALREHMYVHSGQKSYKCDSCEKSFFNKNRLAKHKRDHLTLRSHVCHLCARAFKRITHLNTHLKHVHKNDKSNK